MLRSGITIFFYFILGLQCFAIPTQITLSGFATEDTDLPLDGTFVWEVQFYNTIDSVTLIYSTTGTTVVDEGVFQILLKAPDEILTLDEVWYRLALDTDLDGIEEDDFFVDRFQMTSVPFALSGQASQMFTTGISDSIQGLGAASTIFEDLILAPFSTPAGGVTFNRMSTYMDGWGTTCSFGIYSASGERLYTSGPINLNGMGLRTISVEGKLKPSTVYYAGWASDGEVSNIHTLSAQPIPGFGSIPDLAPGGIIPATFDPALISSLNQSLGISIGLRKE